MYHHFRNGNQFHPGKLPEPLHRIAIGLRVSNKRLRSKCSEMQISGHQHTWNARKHYRTEQQHLQLHRAIYNCQRIRSYQLHLEQPCRNHHQQRAGNYHHPVKRRADIHHRQPVSHSKHLLMYSREAARQGRFRLSANQAPREPLLPCPVTWCAGGFVNFSVAAASPLPTYSWLVTNGTITAGQGSNNIDVTWGTGAGNVNVTASNGCGVSGTRSQSFSSSCREEEELSTADNFAVYPNPAHDNVTVSIYVKEASAVQH